MLKQYWKIECSEHLNMLYQTKVSSKHLSEKRLKDFIQTLIAKYILTAEEILEEHKSIPFKKRKRYIEIMRINNQQSGKKTINFMADGAGISIIAYLVEEIE
ncbi:MAG TPA: hypothetical protein VNQ80_08270 [Parapedobacter sp.]|uniref:hypothetical protein n=1 Tax=Parapedobacter sp. TaxID=1958893 RepID=UPI002BB4AC83|nr:hypothetical protein [Parapedobacter sp.]HWK57317.1 hypothetical protein [Parapedobacter sp.]